MCDYSRYQRTLERKSIHSIEEVRTAISEKMFETPKPHSRVTVEFDGDTIKANSLRYQVFFTKGMTCPICGATGAFFAKEKHPNDVSWHLNLYALDEDGNELLMTKDHIFPKSKGGTDDLSNLQPMCARCNYNKGDSI